MEKAVADIKQIKGVITERNRLHKACMDILVYFDGKENDLLSTNDEPQWDVDYVRNTLQNATGKESKMHDPPWSWEKVDGSYMIYNDNIEIARINNSSYLDQKAVAKIIAAAPELLEALKEARDDIAFLREGDENLNKLLEYYDEIINKAEKK